MKIEHDRESKTLQVSKQAMAWPRQLPVAQAQRSPVPALLLPKPRLPRCHVHLLLLHMQTALTSVRSSVTSAWDVVGSVLRDMAIVASHLHKMKWDIKLPEPGTLACAHMCLC